MPALLERDGELSTLADLLRSVGDGQGRMALVSEPAGIGKSRLLEEAVGRSSQAGAAVLSARGSELEQRHRAGAVRDTEDDRPAPQQRVSQARRALAPRA